MLTNRRFFILLALGLCATLASADSFVYVVNGAQQFGTVNLNTGSFAAIGSGLPEGVGGLVAGPGGSLLTLGVSGQLYGINPSNGTVTDIGQTGMDGSNMGLNFANTLGSVGNTVYATDVSNNLYTVNTSTGHATFIGTTGMPGDPQCGNFPNLCDEALFTSGGKLYATFDSFILGNDKYTANVTANPNLWQIDPTTGAATLVSPTGLHILSATNVAGTIYGFEGFPSASNPLPNPIFDIITLDPSDGDTTVMTQVDPSAGAIYGAAEAPAVPEPASIALMGSGLIGLALEIRRRLS